MLIHSLMQPCINNSKFVEPSWKSLANKHLAWIQCICIELMHLISFSVWEFELKHTNSENICYIRRKHLKGLLNLVSMGFGDKHSMVLGVPPLVHECSKCLQNSLMFWGIGISITGDSLNFSCIHWEFQWGTAILEKLCKTQWYFMVLNWNFFRNLIHTVCFETYVGITRVNQVNLAIHHETRCVFLTWWQVNVFDPQHLRGVSSELVHSMFKIGQKTKGGRVRMYTTTVRNPETAKRVEMSTCGKTFRDGINRTR